ncbi:MAG TPA: hypothetical protein VGA50_07785, partial [Kiloniellales bacterium]
MIATRVSVGSSPDKLQLKLPDPDGQQLALWGPDPRESLGAAAGDFIEIRILNGAGDVASVSARESRQWKTSVRPGYYQLAAHSGDSRISLVETVRVEYGGRSDPVVFKSIDLYSLVVSWELEDGEQLCMQVRDDFGPISEPLVEGARGPGEAEFSVPRNCNLVATLTSGDEALVRRTFALDVIDRDRLEIAFDEEASTPTIVEFEIDGGRPKGASGLSLVSGAGTEISCRLVDGVTATSVSMIPGAAYFYRWEPGPGERDGANGICLAWGVVRASAPAGGRTHIAWSGHNVTAAELVRGYGPRGLVMTGYGGVDLTSFVPPRMRTVWVRDLAGRGVRMEQGPRPTWA